MAKIIPFKAVRPTRENASLVTARSYDDYSAAELAAQLDFNPLSFLHVMNPAYQDSQKLSMERRFRTVHQKYQEFKEEGILVQDRQPAFYIHRLVTKKKRFTGIIVGTSIADYKNDVIKKHEDTLQYRVETFKNYIKYAGFNTEPVLMTYPDNPVFEQWLSAKTEATADLEFSTTKKHTHYLWKIDNEADVRYIQDTFAAIPKLYIADGHHRSASAELLYDENCNGGACGVQEYFMSFLIADSNVRIYEYNRLIKDLNNLTKNEFLQKVQESFDVTLVGHEMCQPGGKHQFSMYLHNECYLLTLKQQYKFQSALESLDAQLLYSKVLAPILGITDLRNDERIEYKSGKHSLADLKEKVDDGEFTIAFVLHPSNIDEIKAIADENQMMPPKSTYIEPKFRSGLVVYEL